MPVNQRMWLEKQKEESVKIEPEKKVFVDTEKQLAELGENHRFVIHLYTDNPEYISNIVYNSPDHEQKNLAFVIKQMDAVDKKEGDAEELRYINYIFATDRYVCKRIDRLLGKKLPWHDLHEEPNLQIT